MQHPARIITVLFFTSLLAAVETGAVAQEESVRPGINNSYKTIEIEQALKRFETEGRDIFKHRDQIVEACKLKPGMAVADVGAGTGLFTRLFSPKVGPKGKVYAVDITEQFIEYIKADCEERELTNVVSVLCTPDSTKLKPRSVDIVFTSDTYHHFEFPEKTLASIRRALKPGGQLIVIDFEKDGSPFASNHVRANKKEVTEEVVGAGFQFVEEVDLMETQYMLRFQKKGKKKQ